MSNHTPNKNNGNTQETSQVKETAEQVQEKASEVAGEAQQQAAALSQQAKVEAKSSLRSQKDVVAQELSGAANALRHTSNTLREQDQSLFAQYSNQVADRVERASTYLQDHDVDDLVYEVEDFARRKPELFIGGAFTLGLLAARFLKSSTPSPENYDASDNYTSARTRGTWRTRSLAETEAREASRETGDMTYTPDRQYPYGQGRGPRPSDMYPDNVTPPSSVGARE